MTLDAVLKQHLIPVTSCQHHSRLKSVVLQSLSFAKFSPTSKDGSKVQLYHINIDADLLYFWLMQLHRAISEAAGGEAAFLKEEDLGEKITMSVVGTSVIVYSGSGTSERCRTKPNQTNSVLSSQLRSL